MSKQVELLCQMGRWIKRYLLKNSREIFTVVELNIQIHGNIFHIYGPISWKNFTFINTISLL